MFFIRLFDFPGLSNYLSLSDSYLGNTRVCQMNESRSVQIRDDSGRLS